MTDYKFQQITPTPARGTLKPFMWDDPNWSAEEKYNGDRRIAQFCQEATRFTGRRVSKKDGLFVEKTDNLPHLNYPTPSLLGTVLDGEMIHAEDAKRNRDVTSIMGSLPARAVVLQAQEGWLRYAVFDCLFYKGRDLRGQFLKERRKWAYEAVQEWDNAHAFRAPILPCDSNGSSRNYLDTIWARGGEGIILKYNDSQYAEHLAWVKVKKELTEDCIITGFKDPKAQSTKVDGTTSVTKYASEGLIGSIELGQYRAGKIVDVGSCSGMTDHMRLIFSRAKENYVGQVVEVEANEREPSGKFQHPRFVRLRPDKNPEDCIWR